MGGGPAEASADRRYEAEVLPGLASAAAAELRRVGAESLGGSEDALAFTLAGDSRPLLELRRCQAVYRVLDFAVPRPKGLLGDQHFRRLAAEIDGLLAELPPHPWKGFRFGAAGSDSSVFRRLAAALEQATGLAYEPEEGELLLRVRPAAETGWQVLLRLGPRPLSHRSWRVCNLPGGINAPLAVVVNDLLGVGPADRYLNLMCGSGTLLIERALSGAAARLAGIDASAEAILCARRNAAAAGVEERLELLGADAARLPFESGRFDRLAADLPWGDAVGSHEANALLYPAFLAEAARVAAPGARLAAVTHELRLFERALAGAARWREVGGLRVFHGGHRPKAYLLERLPS